MSTDPLFGRAAERQLLIDAVSDPARGRALVITGEPGIGKTRLCDELTSLARGAGLDVAWGRCWDGGGAPAFWVWAQVLDGAVAATDDEVDALAALTGATPERPLEPFRLYRGALGLLRRRAGDRGLVVILDDLHDADLASLELLVFVVRSLRGARLVVAATWRELEAAARPDAGRALAGILREAQHVTLGRLPEDAVRALARGAGLGAADVEGVVAAGRGHPLFVRELVRAGGSSGLRVGLEIRELVRDRLDRCGPAGRELLRAASVLAGAFGVGDAARWSASSLADVRRALADAVALGLLDADGDQWAFAHALLREAVYRDLSDDRRTALHRAAADQAVAEGRDTAAVHHLLCADDAVSAAPYAIRAAHRCAEQCAFPDAVALLQRVLDAVPPDGPAEPRIDLALALAELAPGAGRGDLGRAVARQAAELARLRGDAVRFGWAALRYGAEFRVAVVDPVLVGLLREALDGVPPGDSALRARLLARYAAALQPAVDPSGPIGLARDAMAMAGRLGDEETRYDTEFTAMSAMVDYVHPRERAPIDESVARMARARGHRLRELRSVLRLALGALELADFDAVAGALDRYEALERPVDSPGTRWPIHALRASIAAHAGRFAEARAATAALEAVGGEARVCAGLQRYAWSRFAGDAAEAARAYAHAREVLSGGEDTPVLSVAAWHHARFGTVDEVRRALADLRHHSYVGDPVLRAMVTRAAWRARDAELAGRLLPGLVAMEDRWVSLGVFGMALDGPFVGLAGLCRAATGDLDGAVVDLTAAVAACGAPSVRACFPAAALDLAEVLELRARPDDLARARALRASGPVEAAVAARVVGGPFALARAGDVWRVTWAGGEVQLRDSRGMQLLARLVAEPGRELHVLDLAGAGAEAESLRGDAGPLLDAQARAAYRERVEDLEDELAEAESFGDAHRAERARAELDALADELSRSVGLGGRERRGGSAAERARSAVTRRIREAVRRVGEVDPALGQWLEASVVTGTVCVFRPVVVPT